MPKTPKILLLALSVVLVLTVFLGLRESPVSAASEQADGAYRQIDVYSEVLRHIQSDYVTEPNIPAVTNGALRGLLESAGCGLELFDAGGLQGFTRQMRRRPRARRRWG